MINGGIVAENKNVFLVLGEYSKISSISSLNQTFSISSASSSTKYLMCDKSSLSFDKWSFTLPGVQTTIFGLFLNIDISVLIFCHP
jgi:hypothetical protein